MAWLAVLITVWGLASLYLVSDGAVAMAPDMLVLYVGGALAGMATLLFTILGSIRRSVAPMGRGRRWPWMVYAVVIIALVPSLCRYGVPFKVCLALSRDALIQEAQQIPRGARVDVPRWIGLLPVKRVDTAGTATRFLTGSCLVDDCGVAYSPDGEPPHTGRDTYQHLTGPWWSFVLRL